MALHSTRAESSVRTCRSRCLQITSSAPRATCIFGDLVKDGGFGAFHHIRELSPIDNQLVIRQNRDTLYSAGVFDLDAGSVTITMPDAGGRFMSLQIITEDHYVPEVSYATGAHTLTRDEIGTR